MTKVQRVGGLVISLGVLIGCAMRTPVVASDAPGGIAVVELFTSEGCSSCPPADAALAELVADSAAKGRAVYALSFHVDYWNELGWVDPFSQRAFSGRQVDYAHRFKLDSAYTPQVVVNGRTEFVGSDRAQLRDAVATALATPAAGTVSGVATRDAATAKFAITTTGLPTGTMIRVAVVQPTAATNVPKGENGGRTLRHSNVVRAFASAATGAGGRAAITLDAPRGGWPANAAVIAFAQGDADGRVSAAAKIDFPR